MFKLNTLVLSSKKILPFKVELVHETHKDEVDRNINFLKKHLYEYKNRYNCFGFDTLATEDLEIRKIVGEADWALYNMGAEGEYTCFYDAIHNKFAISSTETDMFDALDSFDAMFKEVRKKQGF